MPGAIVARTSSDAGARRRSVSCHSRSYRCVGPVVCVRRPWSHYGRVVRIRRTRGGSAGRRERDTFDLLPAADLSLDHIDARPGNVLVPVRNPHALDHVVAAFQAAGDRDVVVMTVRLLGIDDAGVEPVAETEPTALRATAPLRRAGHRRAAQPSGAVAHRAGAQRRRRDRRDGASASLVRRLRRRVVYALRSRPGTAARRCLGTRREAGASRRAARHSSPQRSRLDVRLVILTAAAAPRATCSGRIRLP